MTTAHHFEPGDYVAWHFGITQFRGHVVRVLPQGDEIVVRSISGVEWHLWPGQIDRLGPTERDEIREVTS